ncbi:MAG: hypothetical protein HAW63_03185 [Bdellovibrionaceae bacterium]|nr:hypothetical protein [Pseudobdellovibrionaceae bacterium]
MDINFSIFRSIQIGVLLAVVYYVSYFNNGDGVKEKTNKVVFNVLKKRQELKKVILEEKELTKVSKLFDYHAIRAPKVLHLLKTYSESSDLSSFISRQAQQLDLSILLLGRVVVSKEKEWEVKEIQTSLQGSYHKLMKFIANIQNEEKLVIIKKSTLQIVGGGSSFGVEDVLQASLSVKLYKFAKRREE